MKKLATFISAIIYSATAAFSSFAQERITLKCEQIGEIKTSERLSAEDGWLMLTTDLYLLNPETLKAELETLYPSRKEKDKVKSVLITAQTQSTTVASEVRYPIYNLAVELVNKELSINKSNTQSRIRLIDNMPLSADGASSPNIKFSAEALADEQPSRALQFATRQLSQIGKVHNDYSAMNRLSEELGKFIEANQKGQQYVFNSTISLFSEMDVDRRLFSICLYRIAPSNTDIERNFTNATLSKAVEGNESVDYALIRKCVADKASPIIVAVNYKSAHKPNVRKAQQLNADYVNGRIVKTRSLYASKLIDEHVFAQEDNLNDFMRAYLELDKENKRYKEAKAKGETHISPSIIIDRYYDLMSMKMQKDVKGEFLYTKSYKQHYDEIMSNAKAILKDGKELEKIERLVRIFVMEKDADTLSASKVKENFETLQSSESLVEGTKWETNVEDLTERYEEAYFEKIFKGRCEKLLEGDPRANEAEAEKIKKEIEQSNCKVCMYQAIDYYFEPLEDKISILKAEEAEREAAEKAAALKAAKLAKKKAMMQKKKK